ncbi:protein of unknown function [Methylotuvimicrobium alcaliphilum 20Z]|uniref:Uncharacterized protein n=1 Tax=Methylotuvimicrobium alcaliphilum (strain DSM 19304 / NCIMB 14124 / VKM B-2133 / 20Z) TaxID=1091494 RepID=G4SVV1_META2|nr:protein of unknown function [Methylotuvimicrobium alcaliphilum 20Z]
MQRFFGIGDDKTNMVDGKVKFGHSFLILVVVETIILRSAVLLEFIVKLRLQGSKDFTIPVLSLSAIPNLGIK